MAAQSALVRARDARIPPVLVVLAIALVAAPVFYPFLAPTDAYVYLAAGERLNDGHDLYRLAPGDRIIASNPPYWDVPTLSPPLLGVFWRPLALLGAYGMLIGWALSGIAFLIAIAAVAWRAGWVAAVATAALAAPIGIQLGLGNVNGFVALGLVAAWRWRERPAVLGALVATLAAVKLTPFVLLVWILATRRFRAIAWFGVASVVLLALSLAGAGLTAHLDYFGVVQRTSSVGSSELSLAGLARMVNVPADLARFAPILALVIGAVFVVAFRSRPRLAFSITVVLLVFGSPVVQSYWLALLLVGLVPMTASREINAKN